MQLWFHHCPATRAFRARLQLALIASLLVPLLPLAAPALRPASVQAQAQVDDCGVLPTGIAPDSDPDGDTLVSSLESCLGTDFLNADSDGDTLADNLEVQGFTLGATSWTADPLQRDTNRDGLDDDLEWQPGGTAPLDADGDGLPNLWDRDNDGDGVADHLDSSPFAVLSAYRSSYNLSLANHKSGYLSLDIQIQTQQPDLMRYGRVALDWPTDNQGQIQDLDGSSDDLELIPVLALTTSFAPSLAAPYGLIVTPITDTSGIRSGYQVLVPLGEVADAGMVQALRGRFALTPAEAQNAPTLKQISLRWMVAAKVDSSSSVSTIQLVASYFTPFRISGLSAIAGQDAAVALFGVPSAPEISTGDLDEGRAIATLLEGFNQTFLSNASVAPDLSSSDLDGYLPAITRRFTETGSSAQARWGLTQTVQIAYQSFAFPDAALATTVLTTSEAFLQANYASSRTPLLLSAYQSTSGALDLGAMSVQTSSLTADLGSIVLATVRQVRLGVYRAVGGQWQALSLTDALAELERRYSGNALTTARALFLAYYAGQARFVAVDGQPLAQPTLDPQALDTLLNQPDQRTLPTYLEAIYQLDALDAGLDTGGVSQAWRDWVNSRAQAGGAAQTVLAQAAAQIGQTYAPQAPPAEGIIWQVQSAPANRQAANQRGGDPAGLQRQLNELGTIVAISPGQLWSAALTTLPDTAFAQDAVTSSFQETELNIAESDDFGISIANFFVDLFTGNWAGLKALFVKKAYYTQLAANPVTLVSAILSLDDPTAGAVVSNTISYQAVYDTQIDVGPGDSEWNFIHSRSGQASDLNDSSAQVGWQEGTTTGAGCPQSGNAMKCRSTTVVSVTPDHAAVNWPTTLTPVVNYTLRYQECDGFIFFGCSAQTESGSSSGTAATVYFDVLPATLGGLWSWSALANPDLDGDTLSAAQEMAYGTNAGLPDSDSDGLSDAYEVAYGSSPLKADSDGDGLNDALERAFGSVPTRADSDGDGLNDGQEVCQAGASGLGGGWLVSRSGNFRLCANPLLADADGDKLQDQAERGQGLSPYAANIAPQSALRVQPIRNHKGLDLTLLKPGDTLSATLSIENSTDTPISSTMTLCLPSLPFGAPSLVPGSVTTQPAFALPAPTSLTQGDQRCLGWNFASAPVAAGAALTLTVQAQALASAASNKALAVELSLPYVDSVSGESRILDRSAPLIVDADPPEVIIAAPLDDIAVNGTSLSLRGSASDATSWPVGVQVSLVETGARATLTGVESWQATLAPLPPDGVYTIRAAASDALGNQGSVTETVVVDTTPPAATLLSLQNGQLLTGLTRDATGVATVELTGTARDTLVAPRGSGLALIELRVDNGPWRSVWQGSSGPQSLSWRYGWTLRETNGRHRIQLRAVDQLGQVGRVQSIVVLLDTQAPTAALLGQTQNLASSQPSTLSGYADDLQTALRPRPTPLQGTQDLLDAATVWLETQAPAEAISTTAVWLGDLDGDGRADAALGMPQANAGAGLVRLLYGRDDGWAVPPATSLLDSIGSTLTISGSRNFGASLAAAGDVDGDGLNDLLIGDPGARLVYLVYGQQGAAQNDLSLSGPPQPGRWLRLATGDAPLLDGAAAGDVDGDGLDDLLIGVGTPPSAWYLVLGASLAGETALDVEPVAAARFPGNAGLNSTPLGRGVGDLNGDGYAELVFSNPQPPSQPSAPEQLVLYAGGPGYRATLDAGASTAPTPLGLFGGCDGRGARWLVGPGDLDADGYDDLVIAGQGASAQIIYGRAQLAQIAGLCADRQLNTTPAVDGKVIGVGDLDADSDDELLIVASTPWAYLVKGGPRSSAPLPVAATLSNTLAIAPLAPHLTSDLNADGADELLALPKQAPPAFGDADLDAPAIALAALPLGQHTANEGFSAAPRRQFARAQAASYQATLTVDDDYCPSCSNDGLNFGRSAFAQIQDAIQAASPGAIISVRPGRYLPFQIGAGKDNLTIRGVDPDAVFVGGTPDNLAASIQINGVGGVALTNLTIRYTAGPAIALSKAGVTPQPPIRLERLVVHDVDQALRLDGDSRASLSRSTLVPRPSANPLLDLSRNDTLPPSQPFPQGYRLGRLGTNAFVAIPPSSQQSLEWRWYLPGAFGQVVAPFPGTANGVDPDNGRLFTLQVDTSGGFPPKVQLAMWQAIANVANPAWVNANTSAMAGNAIFEPQAIVGDGAEGYYVLARFGFEYSAFQVLHCATLSDPQCSESSNGGFYGVPAAIDDAASWQMFRVGDQLVVLPIQPTNAALNGKIFVLDRTRDTSFRAVALPTGLAALAAGAAIDGDAQGTIYLNSGPAPDPLDGLYRYLETSQQWEKVLDLRSQLDLAILGDALFTRSPNGDQVFRSLLQPSLQVANVAFVNTAAGTASWRSSLGLIEVDDSAWVNADASNWLPAPPTATISLIQAGFVDADNKLFRLSENSALRAGYYDPATPREAVVAPTYCERCENEGRSWGVDAFSSVQAALLSGARRVLLRPGNYVEPIYLPSGVELLGAGAELSALSAPAGYAGPLVRVEASADVRLSNLALVGNQQSTGVQASVGSGTLSLAYVLLRHHQSGLALNTSPASANEPQAQSSFSLDRVTLVDNAVGILAGTTPSLCARGDIRNTLFAYHGDTALSATGCSAITRGYNLFWQNRADLRVDGTLSGAYQPDELRVDPLFVDPSQADFRLSGDSPARASGDPRSSAPPGVGTRIAIGYDQGTLGSFFVDKRYCPDCENDGLSWNMNAFDTIGAAFSALTSTVAVLGCVPDERTDSARAICARTYTINVGPGIFTETLEMPSYTRLVGSGADLTTIMPPSPVIESLNVVSMPQTVHSEVRDLTLQSQNLNTGVYVGSGSFAITLTRTIIRSFSTGIEFDTGSQAAILHTTLRDNGVALDAVATPDSPISVALWNSILRDNSFAVNVGNGAEVDNNYSLFFNNSFDIVGDTDNRAPPGDQTIFGKDPGDPASDSFATLLASPVVDAGDPLAPVPVGGGARVDIGHYELRAPPLALLLGVPTNPLPAPVSGVAAVEYALISAPAGTSITQTLPAATDWQPTTLTTPAQSGTAWTTTLQPPREGIYRLYLRARDAAGNAPSDPAQLYQRTLYVDARPPVVSWITPTADATLNAAALLLEARVDDYIQVEGTNVFNGSGLSYEINGVPLAADPVASPEEVAAGKGQRYRAAVGVVPGTYSVVAIATDAAGLTTRSDPRTIVITPGDALTITSPDAGTSYKAGSSIAVSGYIRRSSPTSASSVLLSGKGSGVVTATLDSQAALLSRWSGQLDLGSGAGAQIIAAVAGTLSTSVSVDLVSDRPIVEIESPPDGTVVTTTLALSGTALVQGGELASLGLSLDGGSTWLPITSIGVDGSWAMTATLPSGLDAVLLPALVRARDSAGNTTTVTGTVLADNVGPSNFRITQALPGAGYAFDIDDDTTVTFSWSRARDASGPVTILLATDQFTNTVPTQPLTTTRQSGRVTLPDQGSWYIHLAARDAYGNLTIVHEGPWCVTSDPDVDCGG
jgi:hypothetical protein